MDAALIGPLAAPPAPHVGEAAGAVAASDAPAFAAALASADQTLHDAPTPDVDPVAPSDVATEAATEEATESSLPANDAVTLTQQCLADMAAMLASLNATPTSPPVVAVVSALPETSTTDVDAGPQSSIEAGVEDLLTERDRAAALHDRVVRLRHESGEPTPPSAVPDAATAATADTADIATTANPASAAPVAPSANTTSTATGASPPAIPSAGPSASPPVAASASPSQSLVASVTAALSAPAVSVPSPGGQGVAAREPGARGRVASAAAAPTAATARVAAPSDPIGGDASAATQHSQNISTSTSTPPPQFNWLSAPASAGVNVSGNLSGARMSGEPAFQAQLSAQLFSSDFAPALGVQISTLTRNGIPEARLHLNPAELGPIAVQIELDGRTAQIVLSASHAETRLVLEQAMPQLASAMREAGFSMSGGGVFQQPQQREQRASDGTPKRAGSGVDTGLAPATMTLARVQHGVLDVYA